MHDTDSKYKACAAWTLEDMELSRTFTSTLNMEMWVDGSLPMRREGVLKFVNI